MRHFLLLLPVLVLAGAASMPQQPPACGAALLSSSTESWTADRSVTADFTLDGKPDVAYWRPDSTGVVLLVGACDGSTLKRSWRFQIDLPASCDLGHATVEASGLRVDEAAVARTCATTPPSSECLYLRRENQRRLALMEQGGRELHVFAPGCAGTRLRWAPDAGGFLKIPG
ncbi:MAG: hypothetical protein P8099_04920 [Gemmatimonadota bacterium]|jgi:hypothetical protein